MVTRGSSTPLVRWNSTACRNGCWSLGGGIIGLEMATVYHALGAKVTVVELMDQLIPGADKDLVNAAGQAHQRQLREHPPEDQGDGGRRPATKGLAVSLRGAKAPAADTVRPDAGRRRPLAQRQLIGAEKAGVAVDDRGFIPVDKQLRTNVPHIFAIGDIVGQPMLAHKAMHEGKVAAEVAAGTEQPLRRPGDPIGRLHRSGGRLGRRDRDRGEGRGSQVRQGQCSRGRPVAARDRSAATRASPSCSSTRPPIASIGGGIVGVHAGDLIAEVALAIEMGADAADIGLTIHPHPTLSEIDRHGGRGVRRHDHRPLPAEAEIAAGTALVSGSPVLRQNPA